MRGKTRRALLYIFMSLFIFTMFTASLTFGRYYSEQGSDSGYTGDFEYIISDAIDVGSLEEFFIAVENGYNNIRIDEDVDNPLVISGEMGNLHSDLTIDLNGHELQRNNRDPLLNVPAGINLTIIDTKGGGSLYNPVGSVLRAEGGTITVATGIFESGPRGEDTRGTGALGEYATSGTGTGTWQTVAGAQITTTQEVTVYQKTTQNGKEEYKSIEQNKGMPVIIPKVTPIQEEGVTKSYSVNGNMYFDENSSVNYDDIIKGDTYVYFTIEGDNVEADRIAAENSADYYYTYETEIGGESAEVTIYIYNNVKRSATSTTKYSAIDMSGGNLYVRGGTYYSYFGVENTYCVNASGGYMSIVKIEEDVSFNAYEKGVCVACAYDDGINTENEYLNISAGSFYSETGDTISVSGGRMVVANGEFTKNAPVLGSGTSVSQESANGSAIKIVGGSLNIANADFYISGDHINGIYTQAVNGELGYTQYDSSNYSVQCEDVAITFKNDNAQNTNYNYNYGIYALGGKVLFEGKTELSVIGENSVGILLNGGSVDIAGAFSCNVEMGSGTTLSSAAIYAGNGDITFDTTSVNITSNALGIVATGGSIYFGTDKAGSNEKGDVSVRTTRGTAIYVSGLTGSTSESKIIVKNGYTLNINAHISPETSWETGQSSGLFGANIYNGIYVRSGSFNVEGTLNVEFAGVANNEGGVASDSMVKSYAVRVDGTEGDVEEKSSFKMTAGTINSNVTVSDSAVTADGRGDGGGVYVNNGIVEIGSATINATGYGIALRGKSASDSVTVNGALEVTSAKASAIYITGGSLTLKGTTNVTSTIDSDYINTLGSNGIKSYDGVFVENGSITSSADFTVNFTGIANGSNAGTDASMVKSYAVRVDGSKNTSGGSASFKANGNLAIDVTTNGGGLYVNEGTITLGEAAQGSATDRATISAVGYGIALRGQSDSDNIVVNGTLEVTSAKASAIYITGGSLTLNGTTTVNSKIDSAYINSLGNSGAKSYDGIFVEGGSLTANGALNVEFTGVENVTSGLSPYAFVNFKVTSYAVRVSSGNATISGGTITTGVGGGVYVGGSVELNENSGTNLKVTTQGAALGDSTYDDAGASSWSYRLSTTGGHAVEVVGGSLEVSAGTFEAKHGNGILVRNTDSTTPNTVTIKGGTFLGYNSGYGQNTKVGPSAYAGLYVMGMNLTVKIEDGEFGDSTQKQLNSAAAFFGTSDAYRPKVTIYKGNFTGYNSDAISVFRYVDIVFGSENATEIGNDINVNAYGSIVALSVQDDLLYTSDSNRGSSITIYEGNFISQKIYDTEGGHVSIYYGSKYDILTIHRGNFVGGNGTAIQVNNGYWPSNGVVQIDISECKRGQDTFDKTRDIGGSSNLVKEL